MGRIKSRGIICGMGRRGNPSSMGNASMMGIEDRGSRMESRIVCSCMGSISTKSSKDSLF